VAMNTQRTRRVARGHVDDDELSHAMGQPIERARRSAGVPARREPAGDPRKPKPRPGIEPSEAAWADNRCGRLAHRNASIAEVWGCRIGIGVK
jgi:hypothetical protein